MKKIFALIICVLGWTGVITQFYLLVENRTTPLGEAIIRFFSFFTILTNTLVALFFTMQIFEKSVGKKDGAFTSVTIYITIVGLVYQVLLRHIWEPEGLQMIVDEMLHTIIPLLVIIYWWMYASKKTLRYSFIPAWLVYPLIYLVYVLIRGQFSGFYPYAFIDVYKLGFQQVMCNSAGLIGLFVSVSALFIWIGKLRRA